MIVRVRVFGVLVLITALFIAIGPSAARADEPDYGTLAVRVERIADQPGEIGVALFSNPKGYPTHIEHAYETAWVRLAPGQQTAEVTFEGVPFGDYAVSVLHDTNGNRKLERSTLGFPEEGVGFSNGQTVKLSAPKFSKAKFSFAAGLNANLVIPMDYRD